MAFERFFDIRTLPSVIEIPLTQGKIAKVSREDFPRVSGVKWYASCYKGKWYARTSIGGGKKEYLHRVLVGAKQGQEVKFMNGDTLDCTRRNIQIATRSQILMGARKKTSASSSEFKGVIFNIQPTIVSRPWMAYIKKDGVVEYIGFFGTEIAAALAYDRRASELFGKHARLNFPEAKEVWE